MGKASASVVYDSTVDEFAFLPVVKGKPNVEIVAITTDGDIFGRFNSVAVTK